MSWFRNLFKLRKTELELTTYEKTDIEVLFEQLEETTIQKIRVKSYYKQLQKRKEKLKTYENLSEEEINKLVLLMNRYKAIEEQKQHLRGRLIHTNRALLRLEAYEEKLPEMIKELGNVEKKVKAYERDLFYLAEEKEELEEEREVLLKGYTFLKYFSVGFMMFVFISIFWSYTFMQFMDDQVWIYLSIFSTGFIFLATGMLYAKFRIEKGLNVNEILQKKAVKYMNKTKIYYFHSKRYIEFNFDKLGVDSTAKLELYYNRYVKNKKNQEEYNRLNTQAMRIEGDVQHLMREKEIQVDDMENLKEWLMSPQKVQVLQNLMLEEEKMTQQLEGFETYEKELWQEIHTVRLDPEHTEVIEQKIAEYRMLTKENLDKTL